MGKKEVNYVDFMLILNSCTEIQKRKIETIMIELLLSEIIHAESLIKDHVDIQALKEKRSCFL